MMEVPAELLQTVSGHLYDVPVKVLEKGAKAAGGTLYDHAYVTRYRTIAESPPQTQLGHQCILSCMSHFY